MQIQTLSEVISMSSQKQLNNSTCNNAALSLVFHYFSTN